MTEDSGQDSSHSGLDEATHSATSEAVAMLPTAEQLEIAESILERLKPSDRQNIGSMIHTRGQFAGIILAALGLFWWLSILNLGADHEVNQYTSLINGLSFMNVSWILPILVFFGSLLNAMGRHRGQPAPSMFAGILFLVCMFFAAEPFVRSVTGSGEVSTGLWQTGRLLVLGCGVFISAKLFIEAFLLDWVKKLEEAYFGIEISTLTGPENVIDSVEEILEEYPSP